MPKAKVKADELYSKFKLLDDVGQKQFINLLTSDEETTTGQAFKELTRGIDRLLELTQSMNYQKRWLEAVEKLFKHRKPRRNTLRDAEIVQLTKAGKSAGKVVQAMIGKYPEITDRIVTAVNSRERKRQQDNTNRVVAERIEIPGE